MARKKSKRLRSRRAAQRWERAQAAVRSDQLAELTALALNDFAYRDEWLENDKFPALRTYLHGIGHFGWDYYEALPRLKQRYGALRAWAARGGADGR